ncbi:ABC transporter ATP-binding protein [Solidesulfovibrio sp.]
MLQVENVHLGFKKKGTFWRAGSKPILKGVTFHMRRGECLGLIGASGSGKSTLGRVITGTLRPQRGLVRLLGEDIHHTGLAARFGRGRPRRGLGGVVSIVFQDYSTSVNPRFLVRDILAEPLRGTRLAGDISYLKALLAQVRLPDDYLGRKSFELSGGELQRVCIARALSAKPALVLLDEAVSSLDVSVQFQVLELLKTLKVESGLSYLFISHDLAAVTHLCDRILFFNDGRVVEQVDDLAELANVKNCSSRQLIAAVLA